MHTFACITIVSLCFFLMCFFEGSCQSSRGSSRWSSSGSSRGSSGSSRGSSGSSRGSSGVSSGFSSSSGGSFSGLRAHDYNHAQNRQLFGSGIRSMQRVERPLGDSSSGKGIPSGVAGFFGYRNVHEGVRVTLNDGRQVLIHKGQNFGGRGGETVAVPAGRMSNQWSNVGAPIQARPDYTVSDAIRDGGRRYGAVGDNCQDGAGRIIRSGARRP
jgi:hypothetical protein